uniref:(northern house mosquito) hypothetical protein n=1 Tax=Culex pipiens TaxID=7175 RepID=A0A8D8JSA7_CULPI
MCVGSLLRESTIFSTTCVPILERNLGNASTATRHLLITRIERGTKYLIQELNHTNVLFVKRVSFESASWSSTRVFIRVLNHIDVKCAIARLAKSPNSKSTWKYTQELRRIISRCPYLPPCRRRSPLRLSSRASISINGVGFRINKELAL